jgi:hypothetical protein
VKSLSSPAETGQYIAKNASQSVKIAAVKRQFPKVVKVPEPSVAKSAAGGFCSGQFLIIERKMHSRLGRLG